MDNYDLLSPESRVWIYQTNRPITEEEESTINKHLAEFAQNWTSHNRELLAFAKVWHKRFVVLMVDETKAGASGCSIDSSVHFLQQLQSTFNLDLFDRTTFLFLSPKGKIESAQMNDFKDAYEAGKVNDNTLVFDNLVSTKDAFEQNWQKPLQKSWHRRFI